MPTDALRQVAHRFYDAMNRGDWEEIRDAVDPDFIDHELDPTMGLPEGREGVEAWMAMLREALPDLRMDVHDLIAEGDRIVARVRITGTNTGPFMGMPPTGRKVDVQTIDILRFEDGVAKEHWGVTDNQRMMEQLGLAPTREQMAAIEQVYTAFERRDFDAITELMVDDVELEPGIVDHGIPWRAPGRGKAAVHQFFETLADQFEFSRFEPTVMMGTGGHVAVIVEFEATALDTDITIVETEVHLWTLDERGRITSLRHMLDTLQHAEAAGV